MYPFPVRFVPSAEAGGLPRSKVRRYCACQLGAALFSRIFAINSSDQKKILARPKKMVLEHSQKIGATRQPFLGQLLLFLPTARR